MNLHRVTTAGAFVLGESVTPSETPFVREFQVLKSGSFFDERYGRFEITKAMLSEMVANFKAGVRGIVPALDYDHKTDGVAAGWFKDLFLKDQNGKSEMWASIELTPSGQKSLSDKEYGYLSADFETDYEDNETSKKSGCVLLGAALTNRPVIKRMAPAIQLSEDDKELSNKIKLLLDEGYSQDQAVAIALDVKSKKLNQKKGVSKMTEQEKKLQEMEGQCAEMTKKLGDYKKLEEDMGVASPEALMKMISELKAKVDAMGGEKKELADMAAKLSEMSKKLDLSEKEKEFTVMLAEGKVCEAQRSAFLKSDMSEFAKNATNVKLSEQGHGKAPTKTEGEDVQDVIMEKASTLAKEKKISLSEAIRIVLSSDKKLSEKRMNLI